MECSQINWKDDNDNSLFHFADEFPENTWKVLIVDDEPAIHKATKKALMHFSFLGKNLKFISAYNKAEAKRIIEQHPDTAVILLDVIMDGEKSGLELVSYIRSQLKNSFVRIILRTGQPQEAPEEMIIREYDINDYREKTELTARKLYTAMTAALRSYRDIMRIDTNKRALERILASSQSLIEIKSMHKLADRVLNEMIGILSLSHCNCEKITGFIATKDHNHDFYIIAGTNDYFAKIDQPVKTIMPERDLKALCDGQKINNTYSKFFKSKNDHKSLIYLTGLFDIEDWEIQLLDVLMVNLLVAIDNLYLNQEIEETQKEIIFTLGEFSEARSKETSNHVKRVAEYSKLLALKLGMPKEEAEIIRLASPMHDVGKLGITDLILNKPGRLSDEEFNIIKTHGVLGYEILKNSNRRIMKTGAIIALHHHEKYNGSGYPQGLKGNEIHIYGRITAVADVFDALGSDRVYKKAWPLDEILAYFKKERGQHFDPVLVDLFLDNLPEFLEIQKRYNDEYLFND